MGRERKKSNKKFKVEIECHIIRNLFNQRSRLARAVSAKTCRVFLALYLYSDYSLCNNSLEQVICLLIKYFDRNRLRENTELAIVECLTFGETRDISKSAIK